MSATRVLAIDGGGIRGIIPARVLVALEQRAGRRTAELFDVLAGTSMGGILALGLTVPGEPDRPRYSAEKLLSLYELNGQEIFPGGDHLPGGSAFWARAAGSTFLETCGAPRNGSAACSAAAQSTPVTRPTFPRAWSESFATNSATRHSAMHAVMSS
jgi:predicted acylesterase/phospholipase RssA